MKFKKLIIWLCVLGLTVILGCASFQDALTPCYIPEEVIESTGVSLPIIPWMPFISLFDARYVKTKMHYQYLLYNNLMTTSIGASEAFQQKLFSPTGPIGLMFPTLMGGTLGALLISKPDDKKKIVELEKKNGTHPNKE